MSFILGNLLHGQVASQVQIKRLLCKPLLNTVNLGLVSVLVQTLAVLRAILVFIQFSSNWLYLVAWLCLVASSD